MLLVLVLGLVVNHCVNVATMVVEVKFEVVFLTQKLKGLC